MKCEECRDLLWIYMEWETTPEESAEIKAHLAQCPECRKAASQHMAVMETLRSLPEAELPEGFHAGLMQKITAAGALAEEADETPILPNHVGTPPAEWKVVRKAEILQKAKAEKEREKKQRRSWKQLGLAAAAVLVVVAAGGINGILHMRQTPPESMQLTAEAPDEGGMDNALAEKAAPEDMSLPAPAAGSTEEAQKQAEVFGRTESEETIPPAQREAALPEPENNPEPPMLRAAPMPDSASAVPETASALPAADGAAAEASVPELAADAAEPAEYDTLDSGASPYSAKRQKSGDLLKLRPGNGADAYGSVRQVAEDYAGFEESADSSGISVMIPVENLGAFLSELDELGEVEWQAQGQEEVGATYRRVEILLETE